MIMKKVFQLEELDCANCAAKMEDQINKLDGVIKASVSFMAQKLTLEAEEDKFDRIVAEAAKLIKKIEPDCRLIAK
jgi:copper chaperone CopZ